VELKRVCESIRSRLDGIDVITAQTILSEIGTDMSGFKTEGQFASWLGLTPSKDISGGKTIGCWKEEIV
jgi:transposase